jgi:hypothetical protein
MRFVGGGGIRAVSMERLVSAVEGDGVAMLAKLSRLLACSRLGVTSDRTQKKKGMKLDRKAACAEKSQAALAFRHSLIDKRVFSDP